MKIDYMPTIDCHDLTEELGIHWSDFEFSQMAENGSYVTLQCDDDDIDEIVEEIEWELGKESKTMEDVETDAVKSSSNNYLKRLVNQYKLMKYLREEYKFTMVLIQIYW